MSFTFKADRANRKVLLEIDGIEDRVRRSVRQGFFALGKDLRKTASDAILEKPKGGKTYIRRTATGRKRRHVASAPGETHANMSGKLRRSLGFKVRGAHELEFGYGVDKDAPEYGIYLEEGTRNMGQRPSLGNAVEDTTRNAENYFDDEFRRGR